MQTVLFADKGIAAGLSPGKTVVDLGSISPIETKAFAQKIQALGCDYLDAPVSGGEVGARNATLTIMVGGDAAVFERIKPLFERMGKNITLVGATATARPPRSPTKAYLRVQLRPLSKRCQQAKELCRDGECIPTSTSIPASDAHHCTSNTPSLRPGSERQSQSHRQATRGQGCE